MSGHYRAPLFDRLVEKSRDSEEPRPLRTPLNREGLLESVRRELERLLNTRSSLPVDRLEEREELTVLEYGIPDLSAFSSGKPEDQVRLAAAVARAVSAFEPRLRAPRVSVLGLEDHERSLALSIDATLVGDPVAEPVSFRTVLGIKSGTAEVRSSGG